MTDILARIADYKRADVAGRKAARPQAQVEAAASVASPPRGFAAQRAGSAPVLGLEPAWVKIADE